MAHCNFPNTSNIPRIVQYIKMNAVGPDIISNVDPKFNALEELKQNSEDP